MVERGEDVLGVLDIQEKCVEKANEADKQGRGLKGIVFKGIFDSKSLKIEVFHFKNIKITILDQTS